MQDKKGPSVSDPPLPITRGNGITPQEFTSLPLPCQLEVLLNTRGQERLRYLSLSSDPQQLVRRLPALEVFLTIKEVGASEALDLISLTTPEQLQCLLDLDLWKGDCLDPERVLSWLSILLECGEEKINQFLRSTDPEFLGWLCKKFLRISKVDPDLPSPPTDPSSFTLDGVYFISFCSQEAREILQPFLQAFYYLDAHFCRTILEASLWELETGLEEMEYRWRSGRLADMGFPELEEATKIYAFIDPDSISRQELGGTEVSLSEPTEAPAPTFYLALQPPGSLLTALLRRITDPWEQDRLKREIAHLCNCAIVAEPLNQLNIAGMERVATKVFHYLDLGLQYASGGKEGKAAELLRSLPLRLLFQCGFSTTLLLRRRARSLLQGPWLGNDRRNLVFLDHPYREKLEGMLRKRPLFYRGDRYDDFHDLRDLREAEDTLRCLAVVLRATGEWLQVFPEQLRTMALQDCFPSEWQEIKLSTIFLTATANFLLYGALAWQPIPLARIWDLLDRFLTYPEKGEATVREEVRAQVEEWSSSVVQTEDLPFLLEFWDFCFHLFQEEYGHIPPHEPIDPRFVRGLLLSC